MGNKDNGFLIGKLKKTKICQLYKILFQIGGGFDLENEWYFEI